MVGMHRPSTHDLQGSVAFDSIDSKDLFSIDGRNDLLALCTVQNSCVDLVVHTMIYRYTYK